MTVIFIFLQFLPFIYVTLPQLWKNKGENLLQKDILSQNILKSFHIFLSIHILIYLMDYTRTVLLLILKMEIDGYIPYLILYCFASIFVHLFLRICEHYHFDTAQRKAIQTKIKEKVIEERKLQFSKEELKKQWIFYTISVILVTCHYPIFMFSVNAEYGAIPSDLVQPLMIFLFLGLATFSLLSFRSKNIYTSALYVCIYQMIALNFHFFLTVLLFFFPILDYKYLLLLTLVSLFPCYKFIKSYVTQETAHTLLKLSCFSIVILSLLNLATGIPKWTTYQKEMFRISELDTLDVEINNVQTQFDMPNVYYFLYDEYADPETLEKYSGYDNSAFYRELESMGFTVSPQAVSGVDNTNTIFIMPELMHLGYPVEERPEKTDGYGYVWLNLMADAGYELRGVGRSSFLHVPSLTQDDSYAAQTMDGLGFLHLFMQQTVFSPFFMPSASLDLYAEDRKNILKAFDYYENIDCYTNTQPTFTVLYLCTPHSPFLFDRYGSFEYNYTITSSEDRIEKYLEQYRYITQKITEQMQTIIECDPNSVIILQSDHSYRSLPSTYEEKLRVLNAVYYGGKPLEGIAHSSNVNALRLVVNELFDMDLPLFTELLVP